jgi:uncharacterized protein
MTMNDLPLFPLNTVLFPSMSLTLHIFEERYKQMIGHCIQKDMHFGVALIREGSEVGAPAVPFELGTTAQIVRVEKLEEGRMNIVAVGRKRFRLLELKNDLPYLTGRVEFAPHVLGDRDGAVNAALIVRRLFKQYLQIMMTLMDKEAVVEETPQDVVSLAYVVASTLQIDNQLKQNMLATDSVQEILDQELNLLPKEITRLRMLSMVERDRRQAYNLKIGPFSKN